MTPKLIYDEYLSIDSRQRRYQARRRALGFCISCNKNKLETKNHCRPCADKQLASSRRWKDKQKETQA